MLAAFPALQPTTPLSAIARTATIQESLDANNPIDEFTIALGQGQVIQVSLMPEADSDLEFELTVADSSGVIFTQQQNSLGGAVHIAGIEIPSAGDYVLRSRHLSGSATYELRVRLNAQMESELEGQGGGNDTVLQSNPALQFFELPFGVRQAVVGGHVGDGLIRQGDAYLLHDYSLAIGKVELETGDYLAERRLHLNNNRILGVIDFDRDPVTGRLFALLEVEGQHGYELVSIDPQTFEIQRIGDTGRRWDNVAFDSLGQLFALPAPDEVDAGYLAVIDISTGEPSRSWEYTPGTGQHALALNTDDGLLYHFQGSLNESYHFEAIDPSTGFRQTIPLNLSDVFRVISSVSALDLDRQPMTYAGHGNFLIAYGLEDLWLTTTGALSGRLPPYPYFTSMVLTELHSRGSDAYDVFSVALSAGESLAIELATTLDYATFQVEILNDQGVILAFDAGFSNIDHFLSPQSGTYFIRISSLVPATYELALSVNSGVEFYDTHEQWAQVVPVSSRIVGFAEGRSLYPWETENRDYFQIQLVAGQPLTIQSATLPGQDATTNPLDLTLDLVSMSGMVLASDENGAPDGVNALITYTPIATEAAILRVSPNRENGYYFLEVVGASVGEEPLRIVSYDVNNSGTYTDDFDTAYTNSAPRFLSFYLSSSFRLDSLDTATVRIDGLPLPVLYAGAYDSIVAPIPAGLSEGMHHIEFLPGSLVGLQGQATDGYAAEFIYDASPPRVVDASLSNGEIISEGTQTFRFSFSEQVRDFFSGWNVELSGESSGKHELTSIEYDDQSHELTITTPPLAEDRYTLRIETFATTDLAGNSLDGEGGDLPSGNGVPGGDFVRQFVVDRGQSQTLSFDAVGPAVSQIASAQATAFIGWPEDHDSFKMLLSEGQTLSVGLASKVAESLVLELTGPSGQPVALQSNHTATDSLWYLPTTPDSGEYILTVTSIDDTLGQYSLDIWLNAQLERESIGGGSNDSLATAERINHQMRRDSLGFTHASLTGRLAGSPSVRGDSFGYEALEVPFDFEDIRATGERLSFSSSHAELSSVALGDFDFPFYGRVHQSLFVRDDGVISFDEPLWAPFNADLTYYDQLPIIAAYWDSELADNPSNADIYWEIIGEGIEKRLIVQWEYSGFAFGVAGNVSFQAVLHQSGQIQFNYKQLDFGSPDFDNGASATVGIRDADVSQGRRLLISYEDASNTLVGPGRSVLVGRNIIPPPPPDYFKIELEADKPVSIVVGNSTVPVIVEVFDGSGTRLQSEAGTFSPYQPGEFYFQLSSNRETDYTLTITQGGIVGAIQPRDPERQIRVGVFGYEVDQLTRIQNQLSDSTDFDFTASAIPSGVASSYLNTIDVLVLGFGLFVSDTAYANFLNAAAPWIQQGGSVVVTGDSLRRLGPSQLNSALGRIMPFTSNSAPTASVDQLISVALPEHPILQGLSGGIASGVVWWPQEPQFNSDSEILGVIDSHPLIATGIVGGGRSAFIGVSYANVSWQPTPQSGSQDRLLEQAIAWAADVSLAQSHTLFAEAGQLLTISTGIPAGGPGYPFNNLDPALALYLDTASVSEPLATNSVGSPDGRNAVLTYLVPPGGSGTYRLVVRPEPLSGSGVYTLTVTEPPPLSLSASVSQATAAPGTYVLLEGQVSQATSAAALEVDQVTVTINGQPVTAFDSQGRFFHRVRVQPGDNILEIVASRPGRRVTTELVVRGTEAIEQDFSTLADVTATLSGIHQRTSWNRNGKALSVTLNSTNSGSFPVNAPLLVGVVNISDPSVQLLGIDGYTPAGIPYFDLSNLLAQGRLTSVDTPASRRITFHNDKQTVFDYELVYFARLNQPPIFDSVPVVNAFSNSSYSYDVRAIDDAGDDVTYSLIASPDGMEVDPLSGVITWSPAQEQLGAHDIAIEIADQHGATRTQRFTLVVAPPPANRPPLITSSPPMEARIGPMADQAAYIYAVQAIDPDNDALMFSLVSSPEGMTIDPATGRIEWTPLTTQLGNQLVSVNVSDTNGAVATQEFTVCAIADPSNAPPILLPTDEIPFLKGVEAAGRLRALDPDDDLLLFRLISGPTGMVVSPLSGDIRWTPTNDTPTLIEATVEVTDEHGHQDFMTVRFVSARDVDLAISGIDEAGVVFDPQLLTVSGSALVTLRREQPVDTPFHVLLFEDRDNNLQFESGVDQMLGETEVVWHGTASEMTVGIAVSGSITFAGNRLTAFVDSRGSVLERNEANNVYHTVRSRPVVPGTFDPIIELAWSAPTTFPEFSAVFSMPAVIDLDQDGFPEIVFLASNGVKSTNGRGYSGIVRAISGRTGEEVLAIGDPALRVNAESSLAIGDLDLDGYPEIVVANEMDTEILIFDRFGALIARHGIEYKYGGLGWGGPTLADLDGDGRPEILAARQVFDPADGLLWTGNAGRGKLSGGRPQFYFGAMSIAADIDLDGFQEVIAGNTVYSHDGKLRWSSGQREGHSAVANLDGDPEAEIIFSLYRRMDVFNHDGTLLWSAHRDDNGGPPMVADFDADGYPEIAVADTKFLYVYEHTGELKWSASTNDGNSGHTGAAAFDFDNDGQVEIVYRDQFFLRVYDGPTGSVKFALPMSSNTWIEYPVVADVDGDGSAEIVVVADGDQNGLFVIGSDSGNWVGTRSIWNQHAYHIDNVQDDGRISFPEVPSWLTHNSYRQNALPEPSSNVPAADLVPSFVRSIQNGEQVTLAVRIGNGGSVNVGAGVTVALYSDDPEQGGLLIASTITSSQLAPGTFEDITFAASLSSVEQVWVAVDEEGVIPESSKSNNAYLAKVNVSPANRPPTFLTTPAAGIVVAGSLWNYFPESQDLDGDTREYQLRAAPPGMVVDSVTGKLQWFVPTDAIGRYPVQLLVDDGRQGQALQSFWLEVQPTLRILSEALLVAVAGEEYVYVPQFSVKDTLALEIDLAVHPERMAIDLATGALAWRPTFEQIGKHQIVLRVRDNFGGFDIQHFTIDVVAPNFAPVITSAPHSQAVADVPYEYVIVGQDADGDELSYTLSKYPPGMFLAGNVLHWLPLANQLGPASVTVIVSDGQGGATQQAFLLTVVANAANFAPEITSTPPVVALAGATYAYQVVASDPNSEPLAYSLDVSPAGMHIDSAGLVTWTLGGDLGDFPVVVRVADSRGAVATQSFSVGVVNHFPNSPPRVTSNPPYSATVQQSFRYPAIAIDADGDALTWRLIRAPYGMSVDSKSGVIAWTPRGDQIGQHYVEIGVEDAFGSLAIQQFEIKVCCGNAPPTILSQPPTLAVTWREYVYAVAAQDPEGNSLQFSLIAGPEGMNVEPSTGVIRWLPIPEQIGQHEVIIRATDNSGNVAQQAFALVHVDGNEPVDPENPDSYPLRNRAPSIDSSPPLAADVGIPYEYIVTAVDPDNDSLDFVLDHAPPGMTIDASGVIRWTPAVGDSGQQSVSILVRDRHGAAGRQRFSLRTRGNSPPAVEPIATLATMAGQTYRYTVRASDVDGDSLAYNLNSQTAPPGMTIDSRGRILWNTTGDDVGLTLTEVIVTDPGGMSTIVPLQVNVLADSSAPRLELQVVSGDQVLTGDEVVIRLGTPVRFFALASDNVGVAARTLTLDGQSLPLASDFGWGAILQTPGTFSLSGTAVDAAGNMTQATRMLRVIDPNDSQGPSVHIISPADSAGGNPVATVTYLTPIVGTIDDPDDQLARWRVYFGRTSDVDIYNIDLSDPDYRLLNEGTTEVFQGVLATFDPTLLTNDSYAVMVEAFDANGQGTIRGILLQVEGSAKLGNFRLDFTDLVVPLAGIPIEITRVYDTLQANIVGDFGYGWSLGTRDARILETVPASQDFVAGQTKVYLTTPAGRRVGFTYQEEVISSSYFGAFVRPYFKPDAGVYESLEVLETQVGRGGVVGALSGPYNPNVYVLRTKDGTIYQYDQAAGLQLITDLQGNTVSFTSSAIAHSSGATILLGRDYLGRITEITDPSGNRLRYTYDGFGNLASFTNQVELTTRYIYHTNPRHYLDEAYDSFDRRVLKAVYDENSRFLHVLDAAGNKVNAQEHNLEARTAVIRDANGNATTLLYDDRGNVLEERDPYGNTTYREYTDPRHPDLETRIIDRNSNVTDREYDARGNLTRIIERGTLTEPLAQPVATVFAFDSGNRVTSITNASENATLFSYDARGNVTRIVNALGDSSTFTYDTLGRRETFTDFNGNLTTFEYIASCSCGSPSKVIYADDAYQTFTYNGFGQVTSEKWFEADGTLVQQQFTEYDGLGRVVRELSGGGNDPNHPATEVRRFYDQHLLAWEIIVNPQSLGPDGTLLESPATPVDQRKSRITQFQYNDLDQLIRQVDALGGVVEFRYDAQGNRVALMDPVGNITTWLYDSLNRVVEERDPFYWEALRRSDPLLMALSNHDFLNRVAPVLPGSLIDPFYDDPSGADVANNLGAEHVRVTAYDAEGNSTKTIDRNGRRREYDYDHAGRLLEERWYNAASHANAPHALVETITFSYDTLGNMRTATDSQSDYLFTYDTLNRLESVDNNPVGTRDVPRVILSYGYDQQGNVILTRDDAGVTVASEYDARNRLAVRQWFDADNSGDVDDARVDFLYNAAGREAEVRRYSDLAATGLVGRTLRTYDLSGRSDLLTHIDAVDELLAGYDYDYDFSGLLLHEERSHQDNQYAQSIDYRYDLTGQLTDALFTGQDDEHYEYDPNGNRLFSQVGAEERTYTPGTANQLAGDGQHLYEYDEEGNQIKRVDLSTGETRTFKYDHHNRLVRVDDWSNDPGDPESPEVGAILTQSVTYTYDALGRRIARSVDADGTGPQASERDSFVYNGDNVWADFDQERLTVAKYLFGTRIDENIAASTFANSTWFLVDQVGTVRDLIDSSGFVASHRDFATFGFAVSFVAESIGDRFRFTSREFDAESQLYYYRARQYDPLLGRFLTADPQSFAAEDTNLYRYGMNRPLSGTDPTGEVFIYTRAVLSSRFLLYSASTQSAIAAKASAELFVAGLLIGCLSGSLRLETPEIFEDSEIARMVVERLNSIIGVAGSRACLRLV